MSTTRSVNKAPLANGLPPPLDIKMISAMRVVLALSALAIILIDPSEPDRLAGLTYLALVGYSVYSATVYILSVRQLPLLLLRYLHWVDLAWYIAFIALSSGTNSIFFFFLFFAILVASFWWGFRSGFAVTITAAVLFTLVGYLTSPDEPEFKLNRFLLRPICLVVLGYFIAYRGGYETKLKRRLEFLKNINRFSNPRFGIDRTLNSLMNNLRVFYAADSCLLAMRTDSGDGYSLRRVDRQSDDRPFVAAINDEVSQLLLASASDAYVHSRRSGRTLLYDLTPGATSDAADLSALENHLGSVSWFSVPVMYRDERIGRLFVVGGNAKFSGSDVEFVMQVIDQLTPITDNIRLVDDLASGAAEQERQRIARDIHDGIVQPYIGLNLGLTAISRKLERGEDNVARDINNLSELVLRHITDLRRYVRGLSGSEGSGNALMPALGRYASRFSKATGIDVEISTPGAVNVNDRVASEVFYMITEGLSNIRRHTDARRAEAEVVCENSHLILNLKNETGDGVAKSFRPRSLADRAEALGGRLTVLADEENRTVVHIEIPL